MKISKRYEVELVFTKINIMSNNMKIKPSR